MRGDDIALGATILFTILVMAVGWVLPVILGVRFATRKGYSPHWMWFGLHPMGAWVTFIVMCCLPQRARCPACSQFVSPKYSICPYCRASLVRTASTPTSERTVAGRVASPSTPQATGGSVSIVCPNSACRRKLTLPRDFVGRNAKCPACGSVFLIPDPKSYLMAPTAPQQSKVAISVDRQPAMVLFLFNSDNPPCDTDISYGAFSETKLLKHLFACWNKETGQEIAKTDIKACHGDLFERHPLGDSACSLKKLGKMMQDNELDASRLGAEFDSALRKGTTVGFIPWAVGLFPVPGSVAQFVHEALRAELPEFYIGVICLPPSCQFESTASNLALPQTMRIQGGQLVGDWQGKKP